MPCYQSTNLPGGVTTTGRTGYRTEADCLQACKEGACCEGTTCSVKPQCQCQGATQTFKGVGTTCEVVSCSCLTPCFGNQSVVATVSIQAENYLYRLCGRAVTSTSPYRDAGAGMVSFFQGSAIAGTHALAPEPNSPSRLSKTIKGTGAFVSCDVCRIVLDTSDCSINFYLYGFQETSLASWPQDTEPKELSALDCSAQQPPAGLFGAIANPQWISRGSVTLSSNLVFGVPRFGAGPGGSQGCSVVTSGWPMSFTLPEKWSTEGAYVGFYLVSDPSVTTNQFGATFGTPVVIREQVGSRVITTSLSIAHNPLP